MISDKEAKQKIREAIDERIRKLREEVAYWVQELKELGFSEKDLGEAYPEIRVLAEKEQGNGPSLEVH